MATVPNIFGNQAGPIPLSQLDQDFVACCVAANALSEIAALGGVFQASARTNLGLGTMATQNANAVAITGGTITGTGLASLNAQQTFTSGQAGAVVLFSGSVGGPFIPDLALSNNWATTLSSGITLGFPTNIVAGMSGVITFTQSSSGNCAIVLTSGYVSSSAVVTLTPTPNRATPVAYYTLTTNQVLLSAIVLTS